MNVYEVLKDMGFTPVPQGFYAMVDMWRSWYDGKVAKFHTYRVHNGLTRITCSRYGLGMAKKAAEDWANLLMNEKVKITLEGKAEHEFVHGVLRDNNFAVKANEAQELKAALGTVAYIPRVVGAEINGETGEVTRGKGKIKIDYASAPQIIPLAWENGIVRECAFSNDITENNETYTYLQIHRLDGDEYVIENRLFLNKSGNLAEVPLPTLPSLAGVAPVVRTGLTTPLFELDRLAIANNVDTSLPMGIPCFANAIDQLKGVDIAYDSYVNEFVLGKKRILVKPEAAKTIDGDPVFDSNELVFYALPEDSQSDTIIKEVDMSLRTEQHSAGIQDLLNILSAKCGFGERHYKFDGGNVSTATQIVSENSTLFRTIKKHETILEQVLINLCRTIIRLGNSALGMHLDENVEISIDFDDSIIEDKNAEFARDAQLLSMGILNDWEFRAKWLNEDEATAKAALPGAEALAEPTVERE